RALEKEGIPHEVLNAKQHTREAHVVSQAGRLHAITVATNMAGRGVDIILGGNPEGLALKDLLAEGLEENSDEGQARLRYLAKRDKDEAEAQGAKGRGVRGHLR